MKIGEDGGKNCFFPLQLLVRRRLCVGGKKTEFSGQRGELQFILLERVGSVNEHRSN